MSETQRPGSTPGPLDKAEAPEAPTPVVRSAALPLGLRSYASLIVLLLVSAVMAGVGLATTRGWFDSTPPATPASTPAACRSGIEPGDPSVWTGDRTSASEAVYAAETGALTTPAVPGRDGFVFWGDVQLDSFSQLLGRAPWLDEQRDGWRDYLRELRDALEREGAELVVVVAPSSGTVYPQMLPEWTDPVRGLTHLDQLLSVSGDIPIVDVRGVLRDASERDWVYSAVNSHWNPFGALVAWDAVAECLDALYPESGYDQLATHDVLSTEGQMPPNEFEEWGFAAPRADWVVPVVDPAPATVTRSGVDGTQSQLTWPEGLDPTELPVSTTGGAVDKRVLVAGDSQGKAQSALWAQSFSSTVQIRHLLDDPSQRANILDAARQNDSDLVVLELTERFLSTPAPVVQR